MCMLILPPLDVDSHIPFVDVYSPLIWISPLVDVDVHIPPVHVYLFS